MATRKHATTSLRPLGEAPECQSRLGRVAHQPPLCVADGCIDAAAIIHSEAPYCGKHAFELWESEGFPQPLVKR
jgi:hypothetical protein